MSETFTSKYVDDESLKVYEENVCDNKFTSLDKNIDLLEEIDDIFRAFVVSSDVECANMSEIYRRLKREGVAIDPKFKQVHEKARFYYDMIHENRRNFEIMDYFLKDYEKKLKPQIDSLYRITNLMYCQLIGGFKELEKPIKGLCEEGVASDMIENWVGDYVIGQKACDSLREIELYCPTASKIKKLFLKN